MTPPQRPTDQGSVVVSARARHLERFFPGPLRPALEACAPSVIVTDLSTFDDDSWLRYLHEQQAEVLVTGWAHRPFPQDLLARVPSLRYVCHLAGAVRSFIPRELIAAGLLVSNWGSAVSHTVAECALVLLHACLRETNRWSLALHHERGWKPFEYATRTLFGKRIGLFGFGEVARKLAQIMAPFDVEVFAYSKGVPPAHMEAHGAHPCRSLRELCTAVDILVNVESYDGTNAQIIDEEHLRLLAPEGVFVNVGRGATVDEAALAKVAREGWLQVGLDVFAEEPLPVASPLRGLPNVLLLPHIAGPTRETFHLCGEMALCNIERYFAGKRPEALVTLEVFDRIT